MAEDLAAAFASITAENARLLERLGEGERRFRLISRGVLRLQEAERGRVSRELHDGVGQSLTALKIQLQVLEQDAAREGSALTPRLAQLRELADRTLQDVRQLSRLLRPPMLDDLGLVPTLRWLIRTLHEQTGLTVTLDAEGLEDSTDAEVETVLFRIVQEALTNVAKHAGSSSAEVRIRREDARVALTVRDVGRGFDVSRFLDGAAREPGFGLRGMRDRVQLFSGRFTVGSTPGAGTTIEVELPLPGREAGR